MRSKVIDSALCAAVRREMRTGLRVIPVSDHGGVVIAGTGWAIRAENIYLLPPKTTALLLGAAGQLSDVAVTINTKEPPQTIMPEVASAMADRLFADAGELLEVRRLPVRYGGLSLCLTERGEVYPYNPELLSIIGTVPDGSLYVSTQGMLIATEYGIETRIMPYSVGDRDKRIFDAIGKIDWTGATTTGAPADSMSLFDEEDTNNEG